mgnify:CR=1 FL=1|jgi:dihydrolipoamide dehydrogenase
MSKYDYDLVVIGSGAAGSIAAAMVARAGKQVAMIEAKKLGGDSANYSDIPMQSLLNVANTYEEAKKATSFGIRSGTIGYNFPTLQNWKEKVVKRISNGNTRKYYDSLHIHVIDGRAHFLSPHEISVNRRHLSTEHVLIATGADWTIPDIPGLSSVAYHTPSTMINALRPPKSLFIIGGGSTSLEFARLFSIFGSKVYISEIAPRLLPREDEETGELAQSVLHKHNGVTSLLETRVVRVKKDGLGARVYFTQGHEEKSVRVDEILVASGKSPRVDIGLENASVRYSPRGIEVDTHLQTSNKHIFAAGDVLGSFGLTHVALTESRVVAHNILHPKQKRAPEYTAVPRVTCLNPEIASVGYSEDDLIKRDLEYRKASVPITITGRANITNQRDGFTKILADKKTHQILGATVVSPHAGEVIHEITLAIQYGLTTDDIAASMHAFPSWSEAVRIACSKI